MSNNPVKYVDPSGYTQVKYCIDKNDTVQGTETQVKGIGNGTKGASGAEELELAGLNKTSNPPVPELNQPLKGYTWHHHEDRRIMILVRRDIHRDFRYIGGQSTVNGKDNI